MIKNIIIGILAIVSALTTAAWLYADGNPETNPDLEQTAAQVQTGISIIKTGETPVIKEEK